MTNDQLALALTELRDQVSALRVELRRALRQQSAEPALLLALFDELGHGSFTTATLLRIADAEPHSPIGEAIATLIDLNAPHHRRATALGVKLARMAGIKQVRRSQGCVVYRVASARDPT